MRLGRDLRFGVRLLWRSQGGLYSPSQAQAWREAAPDIWHARPHVPTPLAPSSLSVVVNEAFARAFFPGRDPIGKRFRDDRYSPWVTIEGVVGDVPVLGPRAEAMPVVYFPVFSGPYLLLRSRLGAAPLTAEVRQALAASGASLPVYNVRPMPEVVAGASSTAGAQSGLPLAFAGLALLLAAAGVYGTMASWVSGRTREFGIRMALGAEANAVLGEVLRRTLYLAAVGSAAGVAGSVVAGRIVKSQLYQVRSADPWLLVLAVSGVIAVAALAAYSPARRAARTDPSAILREL